MLLVICEESDLLLVDVMTTHQSLRVDNQAKLTQPLQSVMFFKWLSLSLQYHNVTICNVFVFAWIYVLHACGCMHVSISDMCSCSYNSPIQYECANIGRLGWNRWILVRTTHPKNPHKQHLARHNWTHAIKRGESQNYTSKFRFVCIERSI